MARSKTYKLAKKKAWKWFSMYIRLRDCYEYMRNVPYPSGKCFTCEKYTEFKSGHAGHFISGRGNAVLFEEKGVHLQCATCNVGYDGKQPTYTLKMIEKYGQAEVDRQIALRHTTVKYTQDDMEEIADKYRAKYAELKESKP